MAATLILEGRPELVVRMALLLYLSESEKEKKKLEEKYGCGTDEIEEHIDTAKDVLAQLGWKPKQKGSAEVVRDDPAQSDMFKGTREELPPPLTFTVICKCNKEHYGVQAPADFVCEACGRQVKVETNGELMKIDFGEVPNEWLAQPKTITVSCQCSEQIHNVAVPSEFDCPACGWFIKVEAVDIGDARVFINPKKPQPKAWSTEPVRPFCGECNAVFSTKRENGLAVCPGCETRYEIFLDDAGELLRAVPKPLPETGG